MDDASASADALRDRYYQGTIVRLEAGSRTGWLRTARGHDVPFGADTLPVVGNARGFDALRRGMPVGFDLGRIARGLCVATIRVYESA